MSEGLKARLRRQGRQGGGRGGAEASLERRLQLGSRGDGHLT